MSREERAIDVGNLLDSRDENPEQDTSHASSNQENIVLPDMNNLSQEEKIPNHYQNGMVLQRQQLNETERHETLAMQLLGSIPLNPGQNQDHTLPSREFLP